MVVVIEWVRPRRTTSRPASIRWRSLGREKIPKLVTQVQEMGAWESAGEATDMWAAQIANCIREATKEVLGVSSGSGGRHKGD
ncbi:unnamed protein product [Cuscuta campestris]|uniref:Uncharacterized protein n=1 Tax=Cuscuta campestris TaxID=132261 RepID=A0A484KGQ2_9ASTE|nr:unnamed protein product [Cuscuta campestris]